MIKNKILALNHKMNLMPQELKTYINNINIENKNIIVFPMAIYLPYFLNKGFDIGIQNISLFENGSHTGEISAMAAQKLGANYAIVGHSERRDEFIETDEVINKKVKEAVNKGLKVILCVGEKNKDEDKEKTLKVQLKKSLKDIDLNQNIIIAYEPVWAIGSGMIPTKAEIKESIKFIKQETGSKLKVLYGGSVNENNIAEINTIKILDGYLVGGASLDYNKVNKMIKVVF